MEQQTTLKKRSIYLSTLLMFMNFYFLLGIIAMLKEPLKEEHNCSEQFLGVLDGFMFIGSTIGFVYLAIYPTKRPVLTSFIFSLLIVCFMQLQLLINVFPAFYRQILIVSRLFLGVLTILPINVITIANHYFDRQQDQKWMQIWYSFSTLGEVFGIVFIKLLMENLQLSWELTITLCCPFLLLSGVLVLLTVQQILMQQQNTDEVSTNSFETFKNYIFQYFRHGSNIIQGFLFVIIISVYYLVLLWLPYFFQNLGNQDSLVLLSICYPISFTFGTILLAPIKTQFNHKLGPLFLLAMTTSTLLLFGTWFLGDDSSETISYVILVSLSTILMSGFSSFTSTTDMRNSTRNSRQFMVICSFLRVFIRMFEAFNLVISGYLISLDLNAFFKYYTALMCICCLLLVIRIKLYPQSYTEAKNVLPKQQPFDIQE